jgi:hypothetical protein
MKPCVFQAKKGRKMKKIMIVLVGLLLATTSVSAGTLTINGARVEVNFTQLCKMAYDGQLVSLAGQSVQLGLSGNKLVVAGTTLQHSCKVSGPVIATGGGGNGSSFVLDTSPTTDTPPPIGDGTGTPTPDPDPVEQPNPAGDGDPATTGGYEQPPQGGDVDGYEADNSDTTDTPPPAGG